MIVHRNICFKLTFLQTWNCWFLFKKNKSWTVFKGCLFSKLCEWEWRNSNHTDHSMFFLSYKTFQPKLPWPQAMYSVLFSCQHFLKHFFSVFDCRSKTDNIPSPMNFEFRPQFDLRARLTCRSELALHVGLPYSYPLHACEVFWERLVLVWYRNNLSGINRMLREFYPETCK